MDVVFYVCIVTRGDVGAHVWKSVSLRIYYMFVYCVHPVTVLNDTFCMTCSLLMLVEDARGDNMEEAVS